MKIKYYHIDVFAKNPFEGNPAIICIVNEWLDDPTLIKIAGEFNQPITTFLKHGGNESSIRWFTSRNEVWPCGHGTLAAAFVIKNYLDKNNPSNKLTFKTIKGEIPAQVHDRVTIQLPVSKAEEEEIPDNIEKMIGSLPRIMLRTNDRHLAIFHDEKQIASARPNVELINDLDLNGLVISAPSQQYDFVSRSFAPKLGVNEDYVTGSSHASLAPYWGSILNKTQLQARQLSSRPGTLYCQLEGNSVSIAGDCCLFSTGEMTIAGFE